MNEILKTPPENYTDSGLELMSNFDHEIDEEVEAKAKATNIVVEYPAMNFYGSVWFEENTWYCKVLRYGCHVETIKGDTPKDIMEEATDEYGEY